MNQAESLSRCPTAALRVALPASVGSRAHWAASTIGSVLARLRGLARGASPLLGSSPAGVHDELAQRFETLVERLDASAEQRAAIAQLVERTSPQLYALFEQTREERDVLMHALFAGNVNHAEIERAQSELSMLADRGSELYVATLLELRSVLTPAQRSMLASELA